MTLRYGEVWQVDQAGRVVQATLLWDVLDVLRQCGIWPLAPAKGGGADVAAADHRRRSASDRLRPQ